MTGGHFCNRVWYPAVGAAGIGRFAPHIMRHTAASWLVQDGVPLYDVQMLLGHEDWRYAHLAPPDGDAHDKVVQSWERRRASRMRLDASVTHEHESARLS